MCCFRGQIGSYVQGLAVGRDDVVLPWSMDDEPSGVRFAWRSWGGHISTRGELVSKHFTVRPWRAGEAFEAGAGPSTRTGVGIYAYERESQVNLTSIYGTIALWGKVLRFSGAGSRDGYMGEFGYPYELHLHPYQHSPLGLKLLAERLHGTYPGVWIYRGANERLY